MALPWDMVPFTCGEADVSWRSCSQVQDRVLINYKFGVFYSKFLSLTPIFCKVSTEKYRKTTSSHRYHFYSNFNQRTSGPVNAHLTPGPGI